MEYPRKPIYLRGYSSLAFSFHPLWGISSSFPLTPLLPVTASSENPWGISVITPLPTGEGQGGGAAWVLAVGLLLLLPPLHIPCTRNRQEQDNNRNVSDGLSG